MLHNVIAQGGERARGWQRNEAMTYERIEKGKDGKEGEENTNR